MALADYRLCDVCGAKAFYDAVLTYPCKEALSKRGVPMPEHNVGDWVVLCKKCDLTHRIDIVALLEEDDEHHA